MNCRIFWTWCSFDTTAILDARVREGENVYFPDESHLNETGHALVADALKHFLSERFHRR